MSVCDTRFGFYNHFSGTTLYDPYLYQFFNLFYTALPIMIYAIFDYEYSDAKFMKNYLLYKLGQESKAPSIIAEHHPSTIDRIYKTRWFLFWLFFGIFQAVPLSLVS